jgi:hypothetical protein
LEVAAVRADPVRHDRLVALPAVLNLNGCHGVMTPPMPLFRAGRTSFGNGHFVIAGPRSVCGKRLGYAAHPKRTGDAANLASIGSQETGVRSQPPSDPCPLTPDHLKLFKNSSKSFLCFSTVLAGPINVG